MSETFTEQRSTGKRRHPAPILISAAMLGHTTDMNVHPVYLKSLDSRVKL